MINQILSDDEHQRRYAEAIRQSRQEGEHEFQSWFNCSKDLSQSIVRGHWDLTFHILTRKVCQFLENPEEKTALEIGYGGGRILNAACSYFKEAIGIDIHEEQQAVAAFLRSQGKSNFRLIKTSGNNLEVSSNSVDFIYSFIVLQHLPSFETFVTYLQEIHRCLNPGGLAQLYFGKFSKLSPGDRLRYFFQGYKELPEAPVNHTSLVIRVGKAKELSKKYGFEVLETGTSYKTVPDGYDRVPGGQKYVTLRKPK